ncbi:MAG TPA: hypothetical protein VE291_06610 [Terracidiphilus sp.]|jgi:hypothetical protein|nr:hypothetical protein [Terracidiphilus sp.]
MHLKRIAIPALGLILSASGAGLAWAGGLAPQPIQYGEEGRWDAPPHEMNEIARQGFHDGIDGARRDFDHHREPNVENREEYRHPHVPRDLRDAYRDGFRRGYDRATAHLQGRPYRY